MPWERWRSRTRCCNPAQASPPVEKFKADAHVVAPARPTAGGPAILTDLSRLPAAVARTRDRILAAARSGDLGRLVAVMQATKPTNGPIDKSSSFPVMTNIWAMATCLVANFRRFSGPVPGISPRRYFTVKSKAAWAMPM